MQKYFANALRGNVKFTMFYTPGEPGESLRSSLNQIKSITEGHYERALVLYAGTNLYPFKENLPCESINLFDLYNKMKEVVGDDKTPQQQEMLRWMLAGAVERLFHHLKQ